MARSTWEGDTIVYQYGVPSNVVLPEVAMEQLALNLRLRRDLVAASRTHDEKRAAIWNAHTEVGEAQEAVDLCGEEIAEIAERARKERMIDQTTTPRKETAAELKAAKAKRTAAKAHLKEVRKAALEVVKPLLADLDKVQLLEEKRLRAKAVEDGLFWSTGNEILDDHRRATQMVIRHRKQGRAAERRMPRWDGPASLSTQVMGGEGKPRRSPELLASGTGPWRNVVQLSPWIDPAQWPKGRGRHRHGTLTLRVAGKDKPPVVLPVIIHRPLPADADITDVQLTRRFIADQQRLRVNITIRVPKPEPKTTGETVAVRIGWKAVEEGWIRVATLATPDGGLLSEPPTQIRSMVRNGDTVMEVCASPEWKKLLDRCDRIRGHRDKDLDEIKTKVIKVLEEEPELEKLLTEALHRERLEIQRWRSPRRMVRLFQVWPDEHPFKSELDEWRKRDRHLWWFEAHERDQTIARRRYLYRNVAAWICANAKRIVLSGIDIAELIQVPEAGTTTDTPQARGARANHQWTAPGDLRMALRNAAARRGIEVVETTYEPDDEEAGNGEQ